MPDRTKIIRFFIFAFLSYGIMSIPSKAVDNQYGKFYRSLSGFIFNKFSSSAVYVFQKTEKPDYSMIMIGNRDLVSKGGQVQGIQDEFSTRTRGYLPIIILISLIIASPVKIKRKFLAFLLGILLITIWVLIKQWVYNLYLISGSPMLKLGDFSETGRKVLGYLYQGIVISLTPSFTISVIVWLLVTFRMEDLVKPVRKGKK